MDGTSLHIVKLLLTFLESSMQILNDVVFHVDLHDQGRDKQAGLAYEALLEVEALVCQ